MIARNNRGTWAEELYTHKPEAKARQAELREAGYRVDLSTQKQAVTIGPTWFVRGGFLLTIMPGRKYDTWGIDSLPESSCTCPACGATERVQEPAREWPGMVKAQDGTWVGECQTCMLGEEGVQNSGEE